MDTRMTEQSGPVRVVVADDQRVVREGLVTVLGVLPGIEVVGAAADGEQALALVSRHRPHVVLMDLRMPRLDGTEATRRILAAHPTTAVVVLTTYADDDSILGALRAGAIGYLTKDAGRDHIARAIHAAAAGQAILDPAVQARLVATAVVVLTTYADDDSILGALRAGAIGYLTKDAGRDHIARAIHAAAAGQAILDPAVQARLVATAAPVPGDALPSRPLPDKLTAREAEVLALIATGHSNTQIAKVLVVSPSTVKTHINNIFAKTGVSDRAQAVQYAYQHQLADPGGAS
jgi:DNA-binding NarL/FixJ family response regulator